MQEPNTSQQASAAIQSAERVGAVILPTVIGLGYGIYLLIAESMKTTNGGILTLLAILTLSLTGAYNRSKLALIPAYVLGIYMFGVIGCMSLGLAISEKSSWGVVLLALLWTTLGWRLLAGTQRLRRL